MIEQFTHAMPTNKPETVPPILVEQREEDMTSSRGSVSMNPQSDLMQLNMLETPSNGSQEDVNDTSVH